MIHPNTVAFLSAFKNVTGVTVLEYLNNVRLIRVHNLLADTDYNIEEIAQQTIFSLQRI